jgi:inner membrane protein
MDNLTHSMTAAIAAKFVRTPTLANDAGTKRTIFWLLVASVNFPDLDVVMALFRDPILTIKTHRWITHSVLAAPLFATIPAALFYRVSNLKNFRLLWLTALLGIYIHIVSDLVTPYGTMLLAPFSNHRFTLSSQFIVDLYFTFGLIAFILLGRYDAARQKNLAAGRAHIHGCLSDGHVRPAAIRRLARAPCRERKTRSRSRRSQHCRCLSASLTG